MTYLSGGNKFSLLIIRLTMLFKHDYLLSSVEALNGVIWNKNDSNFVKIFSIPSFERINEERLLIHREIETHDFNGTRLKFSSFQIDNLVMFVNNDTEVTGVHGEMWKILSKMSNFKIQSIRINDHEYGTRSENGSWSGLIGYIYRNETDIIPRNVMFPSRLTALEFTLASWKTTYRLYAKMRLKASRTWMTELFEPNLWYSIIGLLFAVTLANYSIHLVISKEKIDQSSVFNLRDHFFYVFSIFCNQGWAQQQMEKRSKIMILMTRMFAWLLVIAFSSKLISHITEKKYPLPFNDLDSLYENTDYTLIVQSNSFSYSVFANTRRQNTIYRRIFKSGRLIQANTSEAERKMCTGKYVYLEMQEVMEARRSRPCDIIPIGRSYFTTGIAAGVVRGFKYRKSIDLGVLRLQEYGIINRIRSEWLRKAVSISDTPHSTISIALEHISLIFAMLFSALILSIAILIVENIFYCGFMKKQRSRR